MRNWDKLGAAIEKPRTIGEWTYQIFEAKNVSGVLQGYVIQATPDGALTMPNYIPAKPEGAAETKEELINLLNMREQYFK